MSSDDGDGDDNDEYTNLCLSSLLPALSIHILLTFHLPSPSCHVVAGMDLDTCIVNALYVATESVMVQGVSLPVPSLSLCDCYFLTMPCDDDDDEYTNLCNLCCACSFYSYTPHINSTPSHRYPPACQEHNHRM